MALSSAKTIRFTVSSNNARSSMAVRFSVIHALTVYKPRLKIIFSLFTVSFLPPNFLLITSSLVLGCSMVFHVAIKNSRRYTKLLYYKTIFI